MIRVQLDSRPERIDQLERALLQLEVEATALKQVRKRARVLGGGRAGCMCMCVRICAPGVTDVSCT